MKLTAGRFACHVVRTGLHGTAIGQARTNLPIHDDAHHERGRASGGHLAQYG